ncbi:MAG: TolC family protein [Candidatus Aminicenantes bacterium]|nr:TolC family protein [Candidatus Aminicenantes bacterium]
MKRKVLPLLALGLMLGCGQAPFAQETTVLTLEKSIDLALAQNPFYLASRERVDAAEAKVREAASQFFPSLNAQGLQNLDEKVFVLEFPSMIPGGRPQRVAIDFTRDYQLTLSFSVPLYTGGRLSAGYKSAKLNYMSSQESARQTTQETVFNVKRGFYNCLLARQLVQVTEEAIELAEKLLQNVRNMSEVGMASRLDLLRAEVRVANLKPPVIQARNNLALAELSLKTFLGLDVDQPVEIVGDMTYAPVEVDLEESVARSLANRPEVNQILYQKQMAGEMIKLAKADYLPTIAISGNYNTWADQFKFGKDTWQSFYSFNLVLNIPLFNGLQTPAKVAHSKALIRELEHTEKGLLNNIKFEVQSAYLNLNQAKESLLSQEKNVDAAKESVRVAELNYAEGLITITDVGAAQVALSEARINYLRAIYDYVISQAQLEKAMGSGWKASESM